MQLRARTKNGSLLVELAEELAEQFHEEVGRRDRDGRYVEEHLRTLAERGWLAAPVPEELGGRGVSSVHDLLVATSRLARGDAATAIGVSMHVMVVVNQVVRYLAATGDDRAALGAAIEAFAAERRVMAAAISEPGQVLTRPSTTATAIDGGWRIDGRKIFCTMSPAADVLLASVVMSTPSGERYGYVAVPAQAPGVTVHDDWDALGMRTSGSNSVSFDGVRVGPSALMGSFRIGSLAGFASRNLPAGAFHAAAALGIAEAAHERVLRSLRGRAEVDASSRALVADDETDLHVARAALARAGDVVDVHFEEHRGRAGDEDVLDVFGEVQAAKVAVGAAAMRVVDRSLLLSGGSGYRAGSALARAVGDVRALMFMNPLSTTRATTFLAERALGLPPSVA